MAGLLVLTHFSESHPFEERRVTLHDREKVHVGRCNGVHQSETTNTIFDCKVLSRNHALVWYENGTFWLQDTRSANGTFVNAVRVGKANTVSDPYELHSRDVIQFGVSVTENAKRTTHECIIAEARLFHPDGQEALQNATIKRDSSVTDTVRLYELSECLQDLSHREAMIEQKVTLLQEALADICGAADQGWKAMINEDRLLAKIDALETQLSVFFKEEHSSNEDDLSSKRRIIEAQEEKARVEEASRELYTKILDEKLAALRKVHCLEPRLASLEEENRLLHTGQDAARDETARLLQRQQEALAAMQLRCEQWEGQVALSVGEAQRLQEKMDEAMRENDGLRHRLREMAGPPPTALREGAEGAESGGRRVEGEEDEQGEVRETDIISDDLPISPEQPETRSRVFAQFEDSSRMPSFALHTKEGSSLSAQATISPPDSQGDVEAMTRPSGEFLQKRVAELEAVLSERDAALASVRENVAEARCGEYRDLQAECDRLSVRVREIEAQMAEARRENASLLQQLAGASPVPNGDLSPRAKMATLSRSRQNNSQELQELQESLSEVTRNYDEALRWNKWPPAALPSLSLVLALALATWAGVCWARRA